MDEELKNLLENMAAETRGQFAETNRQMAEMRREAKETATETRRHFEVVAEGLKAKIETVAEGVLNGNQRIDRLGSDIATEFNDVRSMIKFSHHDLDRRVRTLEEVVSELQVRVDRLESSTH